jgi:glycosyltransferase involved in cell wall biosynthesis
VNGSRFEDFGAAQLEALASGCLLVSVPSRGPIECLPIVREIGEWLVADRLESASLAGVLETAMTCEPELANRLRAAGRAAAQRYSRDAFEARLGDEILILAGSDPDRMAPGQ